MYRIPDTLTDDIKNLSKNISDFEQGVIDGEKFKIERVPMGIYEQRKDNTYMARIRTTGGIITPEQFLEVLRIGKKHGSNLLHITTRQEIQLQNLNIDKVEAILSELYEIGLSTKGGGGNTVRNILVNIDSGILENEAFDVSDHALSLTSHLIKEYDSFNLPRKLKIAFSSDESDLDYAAINDIGFVATTQDNKKGFKIYVGGSVASKPTLGWVLFDFIPEEELYIVAEAVKRFFSEHGDRKNRHKARLRYVFYKLGEEQTLKLLREYYAQAKLDITQFTFEPITSTHIDNHTTEQNNIQISADKGFILWKKRYVVGQKQSNLNSIILPFVHGNIWLDDLQNQDRLISLLHYLSRFGNNVIRFSTLQNIHLRNIPEQALGDIYTIIKDLITDIHLPLLVNNIVSCTGADTCRLGIGLSKGLAYAIREELKKSDLDFDKLSDFRINISGCPNSCGQQIWSDLGFSGRVLVNEKKYPAYQVYAGAQRKEDLTLSDKFGSLAAKDVPRFVVQLLKQYLTVIEKYTSFKNYLDAEGKQYIDLLLDQYKKIPSFEENPDYYSDWGSKKQFSTNERSAGECAVGPFDLIAMDIKFIAESKEKIESELDSTKISVLLYDILYSSTRMLLVTKQLEAKKMTDAFDLFITHFIKEGLVDTSFTDLVEAGKSNNVDILLSRKDEIFRLADTVITLYGTLDNSLQFKKN